MKLTTQEEYGLRCLLELARHGASLTVGELSRREGISAPNVAKIMHLLRRSGFVRSTRGQAGGYVLAQGADQVTVGGVLDALGTRFFDAGFCKRHAGAEPTCTHLGDCSIRPVLEELQSAVDRVLGRLTLAQLLRSERERRSRGRGGPPRGLPVSAAAGREVYP
jgi:Rrf2 family protein